MQSWRWQGELAWTQLDTIKFEKEKEYTSLKERLTKEIHELSLENQWLEGKIVYTKDRDTIRELDTYKRRYETALNDVSDMQRERDELKSEMGDMTLEHTKAMEQLYSK